MADAVYAFAPGPNSAFQFDAQLDGQAYTCVVAWNIYSQRYFLTVFTLQSVRVVTVAMVASPLDYDVSLTEGYFATAIVWREVSGVIEVGP